jgi:hypothetical protein
MLLLQNCSKDWHQVPPSSQCIEPSQMPAQWQEIQAASNAMQKRFETKYCIEQHQILQFKTQGIGQD